MTFNPVVQTRRQFIAIVTAVVSMIVPLAVVAETTSPKIGVVVMHGKGGSPTKFVSELAASLEEKGYLVANLEMPWSRKREYDVDVRAAEQEVESALAALRSKGAQKLFVAGHSQGGLFALYFGNKHVVDGIVAIAPGGNVASSFFRGKVSESVESARKLISEGKGSEKVTFNDFEGAKGTFPVVSAPSVYLSWFDPDGAMNQMVALKNMNRQVPVLFIVPTGDYPALQKGGLEMFNTLPRHPLNKHYEPSSDHTGAPSASRDEIARWTAEVGKTK